MKEVDLDTVKSQLPVNLREIVSTAETKLTLPHFSLGSITMTRSDGKEVVGLEIMSMLPSGEEKGVVVMEIDDMWYIALLDENLNSSGGWEKDKNEASADDIVKAVEAILSEKLKN